MEQKFLSVIYDQEGKSVDFERWPQKKLETVKKNINVYYNRFPFLKKKYYQKGFTIKIFCGGYDAQKTEPVFICGFDEIIDKEL